MSKDPDFHRECITVVAATGTTRPKSTIVGKLWTRNQQQVVSVKTRFRENH